MTDLVKRLRSVDCSWSEVGEWCAEAADRIEALETQNEGYRLALAEQLEIRQQLEYENGSLKAIVHGWHWLAVGPDEMGDYYTQKQLIKASEPYASPALKKIGGD